MPFQHSSSRNDVWRAHELCMTAAELGYDNARWLAAPAYDRWLMYQDRPQKYGTQFPFNGERWELWPVDPATTDDERAEWHVPSLEASLRQAAEMPVPEQRARSRLRNGDLEVWAWPPPREGFPPRPHDGRAWPLGPVEKTGPLLIGWAETQDPLLEPLIVAGRRAILVSGRSDGNLYLVVSLGDHYQLYYGSDREELLRQASTAT